MAITINPDGKVNAALSSRTGDSTTCVTWEYNGDFLGRKSNGLQLTCEPHSNHASKSCVEFCRTAAPPDGNYYSLVYDSLSGLYYDVLLFKFSNASMVWNPLL
jgi:hypothetical protein